MTSAFVSAAPEPVEPPTSPGPIPAPLGPSARAATAQLAVEGMHCGSCVALIEETLTEQAGVSAASVDLGSARAVVHFDPSLMDADALRATVAEAGYSATVVDREH